MEKENIYVGIKVGDIIEISYTVTRYGSYYLDIKDNQHTGIYSNLETNLTTSQNGVICNKSFEAAFDTGFYEVRLYEINGTLTSVYGEIEIYSLSINGERIL